MDTSLVRRAMRHTTGADVHAVSGLLHEYACADRLAQSPNPPPGFDWHQTRHQIEHCLRLYLTGTPLPIAKRLSGHST